MCISVPGRVIQVTGSMAEVENTAGRRWFSALSTPEVAPGDWVYTHAHLVVAVVSETEANESLEAYREIENLLAQ